MEWVSDANNRTTQEGPIEFELQQVWRTLSKTNGSGFFVWEVVQVMGQITSQQYFVTCRDGSYIMVMCHHSFTESLAIERLHDNEYSEYQLVTII